MQIGLNVRVRLKATTEHYLPSGRAFYVLISLDQAPLSKVQLQFSAEIAPNYLRATFDQREKKRRKMYLFARLSMNIRMVVFEKITDLIFFWGPLD